jgi:protein TonB
LRAAEVSARSDIFMLVLVVALHIAGVALLLHTSKPAAYDELPSILAASWIIGEKPASPEPPAATVSPRAVQAPPVRPRPSPRPHIRPQRTPRPVPQPRVRVPESPVLAVAAEAPGAENLAVTAPEPQPDAAPDSGAGATADAAPAAPAAGTGKGGGSGASDYIAPDFNANYLSNPDPDYPATSNRLREQGVVRLRVHVTEIGRPSEIVLDKSSGYARLDKAATEAVWRWQFRPASRAGVAVAAWVVVPIKFNLRG